MKLVSYGVTYEGRELLLAIISSEDNIKNLEQIRTAHLNTAKGIGLSDKVIVWLSYNVHGNEAVSSEAAMQTIYDLLTKKEQWLTNTVIIIDPCLNPDGRDRYVNWYNQFKNTPFTTDPNSKEHHEEWLSGRPNHYMFDLNRDWAWITQKESRQRLKMYNEWLPHIHVDFHEQGINAPYYFAPAAEPLHEVITDWQRDFQVVIGKNNAKYFDANGWFYFTKEVFDLLYPSYGDTYPTYNGAIGMTYEQGGSGRAGLGILTAGGNTLTLKDRLDHHYTTGLSTIEIASANAGKLNEEFQKFYQNKNYKYKSYVLSGDKDKITLLTELLDAHNIEYGFAGNGTVKGYNFSTGKQGNMKTDNETLVVNTDQLKGTLVKVLFEPKTQLSDSLTYDITAWSLPYAYDLNAIASTNRVSSTSKKLTQTSQSIPEAAFAYITDWTSMNDARFLTELLNEKIKVRYTTSPFEINNQEFKRGSLIITRSDNKNKNDFGKTLQRIANKHHKNLFTSSTGFVDKGKDFGSDAVKLIREPKIAVLSGGTISTLNFGETWHFFEQQLNYPITAIDHDYFDHVDLSAYNIIILPEVNGTLKNDVNERLINWVKNGGKLIAIGSALKSFTDIEGIKLREKKVEENNDNGFIPDSFENSNRNHIKSMITGAIFKAKVDTSNPLSYGYDEEYFTLKLDANSFDLLENNNAVYLDQDSRPYNGFAGSSAIKRQQNSLVFGSQSLGSGNLIFMVDNPLFRGFWEGGKLFMANALFFSNSN